MAITCLCSLRQFAREIAIQVVLLALYLSVLGRGGFIRVLSSGITTFFV